jgi:ribosomal protein L31
LNDTYKFSFPSFVRDEFDKKFARVNKKLASMKEGNEVQIVSEDYHIEDILKPEAREKVMKSRYLKLVHRYQPTPEDYLKVNFTTVEVSLPIQTKINGYQFAGTINIEGGVKSIFSIDDDVNLAEVDVMVCHHCGTRRKRNRLHVFTEVATGEHKAIGSTCVHEYLGLDIDKVLHTFFNFYKEEDIYRGMRSAWGFSIENLTNACRVAYSLNPDYVKAGDPRYGEYNSNNTKSTVDYIYETMYHPNTHSMNDHDRYHEALKSAPKVGDLLMETYGDMDEKKSNFNSNIVESLFYTHADGTRALRDFIVGKSRGIFIWAVYNALKKANTPKPKTTPSKPSNHVGKVGERICFTGEVTFAKVCDGYYGQSKMVKLQDKDGNNFVSFGTGNGIWDLQVGDEVSVKGTVSKHDEFKGTKQTNLKRLTIK